MSYYTRQSVQRYQNAVDKGTGRCRCGTQLKYVGISRTVRGAEPDYQIKPVLQLYCPNCERIPKVPPWGTDIDARDVVEVVQVSPRMKQ